MKITKLYGVRGFFIFMDKQQLRQQAKNIRDAITASEQENAEISLKSNILEVLNKRQLSGIVGTYYPIGSEIKPPHILDAFETALPIIRDKVTLEFYKWHEGDDLINGRFDIPIPKRSTTQDCRPDIVLLPMLMCDVQGNRLGYGAGHYDRYIASRDDTPLLIGVCFEEQISKETLPYESHDQRLDLIITPKRIIEIA